MLRAAPLEIPTDCAAPGSYIVSYTVEVSGRTRDIQPSDAPACVQQALSAWVASFHYAPPSRATPATVEWLMVTAKRGS